ncbi:MAG TPA: DUF2680 domain-containing protein [Clostridiaceae bacterium]|nr:DUF2680 domain-containing protein [Clostridiaceae bacterium]
MKLSRILSCAVVAACLTTTMVFAAPGAPNIQKTPGAPGEQNIEKPIKQQNDKDIFGSKNHDNKHDMKKFKDPLEALKQKKEKIQSMLKEGKITKEKADEITAKIDKKIKEIEEFNKLSPEQKKANLTDKFKAFIEKRVKKGKLTREEADEMIKKFNEKLQSWDGKGYPDFFKKGFGFKGHHCNDKKCS